MNIYTIIFIGGYLLSLISIFKNTKKILLPFLGFTIFTLFMISGFRSMNVGYDNVGHQDFFNNIANGNMAIGDFKEPGYTLLSWLVSHVGGFNLFLVIYAVISILILVISIKYFSINPYISIYIYYTSYFLGNNMAKLRQSMSVLILLLALIYLNKDDRKSFFLIVLIAAIFHASALFFLIILFLNKIDLSKKKMYLFIVLSVLIGQSGIVEFIYYDWIGNSQFIQSLNFLGLSRLANYANLSYTVRESGGYLGYLYTLVNSILVVLLYDKLKNINNNKGLIIAKTFYWGCILFFLLFNLSLINERLTMPFLLTQIFLIPYFLKVIENKYLRILFVGIYLLVLLIRGYMNFLGHYDNFVPFEFFWEQ